MHSSSQVPTSMEAAVCEQYGPPSVVQIRTVAQPIPKPDEVLVRVYASTVSSADWRLRSLSVPKGFRTLMRLAFGISKPRKPILGTELAGVIEAIGERVQKFAVGDRVFAYPGAGLGCHAQFRCISQDGLIVPMPANASFEEAAALSFGGSTAIYFLRNLGKLKPGEKLLVVGASGCVGSAAIQLGKYFGASVTGVTSTANCFLVKSLGAEQTIDYTSTNWHDGQQTYDVVFDTIGATSLKECKSALNHGGRLLMAAANLPQMLQGAWSNVNSKKALFGDAKGCSEDLYLLKQLFEEGTFRPVIDRSYPLKRIVEAYEYVDTGRKKGSVVLQIEP